MGFFDFFKREEETYDLDADDIFYATISGGWYPAVPSIEAYLQKYEDCEQIAEAIRKRKISLGK